MSYLLHTNVISELRKGKRADSNLTGWFAEIADDEIFFLSVLTVGEIRRGSRACDVVTPTRRPPSTVGSPS